MVINPEIPVLVPTLATAERRTHLIRALASIRAQTGCRAVPVVIVNGDAHDPALVSTLYGLPDVRVLRVQESHMGAALAAGRQTLTTEYFAELDDDDELLPHALVSRLARMQGADAPDVVVSNSILRGVDGDRLSIPLIAAVARQPLRSLMERNWLIPGSALFRTERLPGEWFASMPRYLEWTYLALRLCQCRRLAFLGDPTAIHHEGHGFSVAASLAARLGAPAAIESLLSLDLPPAIRRRLRRKQIAAFHQVAEACRANGDLAAAWRAHRRSLESVSGWRFLAYTRHLLKAGLP